MSSCLKTILTVDDDLSLRCLLRTDLEDRGYAVLTAGNGAEATEVCQVHQGQIHLMITDICLTSEFRLATSNIQRPSLNGIRLACQIRTLRPEIHILFISALPEPELRRFGWVPESASLVRKPFRMSTLLEKIDEVLEHSAV